MKIKSIPDDPRITLSTVKELVEMYEDIEDKIDETGGPTSFAYDLGRLGAFELFFRLLGIRFETGDEA